jgi:predicted NAD-dependent protein-ADP-ribosyltransferase YbiA (DUF1768 family)
MTPHPYQLVRRWLSSPSAQQVFPLCRQASVIAQRPNSLGKQLGELQLPCWASQRLIAAALGHHEGGINAAMASLGGKPYLWATEFENVHSLWRYNEPQISIDGCTYRCSEAYYHAQKPARFDDAVWDEVKEEVMEKAVRAKLAADPFLEDLLRATGTHPLLSLKDDAVWGFSPTGGGQNLLAEIWMRVRAELLAADASSSPSSSSPTMMQLHLLQPKKIHSEQTNGLLQVLSVGPPRENIMGRFSVPTLWRMRAVCQSCRAWGCEALTALPRPIVIAGVTFPRRLRL